jgi:quercetin dioxygenase-like cupin family protein/predicted small metal-binding protein
MSRKLFDCRDLPGECTLTISGEEDEVVRAQAEHAISVHGEKDTVELRELIRASLKEESPAVVSR